MGSRPPLLVLGGDVCALLEKDLDQLLPLPQCRNHERGLLLPVGPVHVVHQLLLALLEAGVLDQETRDRVTLVALKQGRQIFLNMIYALTSADEWQLPKMVPCRYMYSYIW